MLIFALRQGSKLFQKCRQQTVPYAHPTRKKALVNSFTLTPALASTIVCGEDVPEDVLPSTLSLHSWPFIKVSCRSGLALLAGWVRNSYAISIFHSMQDLGPRHDTEAGGGTERPNFSNDTSWHPRDSGQGIRNYLL